MRIGELAAATGTTPGALRFYEAAGLLDDPGRAANGYRDYPAATVDRVRFVRSANRAGLTLAQVREVLAVRDRGAAPCAHVGRLVERRLADVDARIRELEALRAQLAEVGDHAERLDPRECDPSRVCEAVTAGAHDDGRSA